MFQDTLVEAMKLWHGRGSLEREVGAHASSGGWCKKKAILEILYPDMKSPLTEDTKTVFMIGHDIHDRMDEVLRLYAREHTNLLWIQPWRVFTLSKVMKEAYLATGATIEKCPIPLGVFGTPDGVIIDVTKQQLIVPDFKSSNERAFSFKVKGSRSFTHEVQLGAYLPGIQGLLCKAGLNVDIEEASIIYINKTDYSLCTHNYDPMLATEAAKTYWQDFATTLGEFVKGGGTILPVGDPPEKWMCNYCSLFKDKSSCNEFVDIGQFLNQEGKGAKLL